MIRSPARRSASRVPSPRRRDGQRGNNGTELGGARLQVAERVLLELAADEDVGRHVGEREHDERQQHHRGDEPRHERPSAFQRCGLEAVADTSYGVDLHGAVELLADLRDVNVDGARVAEPVVTPHAVEDLLAAQRESRPFREELEQLELLGRERDDAAADPYLAPAEVDRRVAGLDDLRAADLVGAAQHRLHPRHQLGRRERLGHVVVGAELESEHAVDLAVARGEEDHRDRGGLAEPAAHLETVDVGQADVEHDQAGPVLADGAEPAFAGSGLDDAVALACEVELDQVGDVGLVVDDEHGPALHTVFIVSFRRRCNVSVV